MLSTSSCIQAFDGTSCLFTAFGEFENMYRIKGQMINGYSK